METANMESASDVLAELVVGGKQAVCEVCGNAYDKCLVIQMNGEAHVFDSFECAIHALAPTCAHCGCRILGHGMETEGVMYCCAHCARHHGIMEMEDRVEPVEMHK